jgi:hypothetical protein
LYTLGPRTAVGLTILLTGGILFILTQKLSQDTEAILQAFSLAQQSHYWALLIALALLPLNLLLESLKWRIIIQPYYPHLSISRAIMAVLVGNTLAILSPFRLGEYFGRIGIIPPGQREPAALATIADRMIQLFVSLLAGSVAIPFLVLQAPNTSAILLPIVSPLVLLTGSLLLFFIAPTVFKLVLNFFFYIANALKSQRLQRWLLIFTTIPYRLTRLNLGLALLRYLVFLMQYILLMYAFGYHADIGTAAALVATIFLLKSFIPSLFYLDMGVREVIAIGLMGALDISTAIAFSSTFTLYLINILLPALAGIPFAPQLYKK